MADSLGITAVKWSWRSDASWIDFDKAFNYKLETAYHSTDNSVKKVKVDKERFIDLTLSPSDIKKTISKNRLQR
jgi:transposase-like protein